MLNNLLLFVHIQKNYCTCQASKLDHKLTKKETSKKPRGFIDGYKSEDSFMGLVLWNDNSIVQVVSSAYGWKTNNSTVKRLDEKECCTKDIPIPKSIKEYN